MKRGTRVPRLGVGLLVAGVMLLSGGIASAECIQSADGSYVCLNGGGNLGGGGFSGGGYVAPGGLGWSFGAGSGGPLDCQSPPTTGGGGAPRCTFTGENSGNAGAGATGGRTGGSAGTSWVHGTCTACYQEAHVDAGNVVETAESICYSGMPPRLKTNC